MNLKLYRILMILSGIFTCYYGASLIEQIKYVPDEFIIGLIAFVLFICLFNVENREKQGIIKIKYADLHENLNELLIGLRARFEEYMENNYIKEIEILNQETRHYISIISLVINTHQRPHALSYLLNNTENDQTRINRQLIDLQKDYLLIEEKTANYLYEKTLSKNNEK